MNTLVWFRADLRVADNTALHHASADGPVIAVFVIAADQWREHDWGPTKVDFILRTLLHLRDELAERNIPLRIVHSPRFDDVPAALLVLARECACHSIFFNEEYEINETRRDRRVRSTFEDAGLSVESFSDLTLFTPGTIRTNAGSWYTIFTPFKRTCLTKLDGRMLPVLPAPERQQPVEVRSDDIPKEVAGFKPNIRAELWPAGEAHAALRLDRFVTERIAGYADDRDRPDLTGTSVLSPYLAVGAISPRQCLAGAMSDGANSFGSDSGASAWVSELLWREFYIHLLVGFPRLSMNLSFKRRYDRFPWRDDETALEAWGSGRTGIPIIDAAMRQLRTTGWMHNRCRMITAMFLTKNLLVDWRNGERHFMKHLIDGNLAANNGGWQWSASTGCDAVPYFRIFNPIAQSKRCDPSGNFIRQYVPELAALHNDSIHEPWKLASHDRLLIDYPEPIIDLKGSRTRAIETFRELLDPS